MYHKRHLNDYIHLTKKIMENFKDLDELTQDFYHNKLIFFGEDINDEEAESFLRKLYYMTFEDQTLQLASELYKSQKAILQKEEIRFNFVKFDQKRYKNQQIKDFRYNNETDIQGKDNELNAGVNVNANEEDFNDDYNSEDEEEVDLEKEDKQLKNNDQLKINRNISDIDDSRSLYDLENLGYSTETPGYITIPINNFNYYDFINYLSKKALEAIQIKRQFSQIFKETSIIKEELIKKYKLYDIKTDVNYKNTDTSSNFYLNCSKNELIIVKKIAAILEKNYPAISFEEFHILFLLRLEDINKDSSSDKGCLFEFSKDENGECIVIHVKSVFNEDDLIEILNLLYLSKVSVAKKKDSYKNNTDHFGINTIMNKRL